MFIILATGLVYTFGSNTYGQLGIGNSDPTRNVSLVDSLENVINVSCGDTFTVAVTKGEFNSLHRLTSGYSV